MTVHHNFDVSYYGIINFIGMKIGTINKEQIRKADRRARREDELGNGWSCTHKVHRSKKTYSRKDKHKKQGLTTGRHGSASLK